MTRFSLSTLTIFLDLCYSNKAFITQVSKWPNVLLVTLFQHERLVFEVLITASKKDKESYFFHLLKGTVSSINSLQGSK